MDNRDPAGYSRGTTRPAGGTAQDMCWSRIGHGLAAGAAGVTTLNAITYLDVSLRARPSSDSPSQAVEQLAAKAGGEIPGKGDDRDNRLAGLGPLTGILVGTAIGVTAAFARPVLAKIPAPLAAATLGALAMAGSDGPLSHSASPSPATGQRPTGPATSSRTSATAPSPTRRSPHSRLARGVAMGDRPGTCSGGRRERAAAEAARTKGEPRNWFAGTGREGSHESASTAAATAGAYRGAGPVPGSR